MSTTDAEALAAALFDARIVSLAASRREAGIAAFPLGPDAERDSYFEPLTLSSATLDMAFPGEGTPAGLIDALGAYYNAVGEPELAALIPSLHAIAAALQNEDVGTGEVDILCYTMF